MNARDSMPAGGRLGIESSTVTLDESYCRAHPWASPGTYARLSVTDTGAGMSADVLRHVFEPFFSTKPLGKGTGLGLAMVYGAVKQNGGLIDIESAPGRGTSVRVFLPPPQDPLPPQDPQVS
jgi:signal transduction histidine kinase